MHRIKNSIVMEDWEAIHSRSSHFFLLSAASRPAEAHPSFYPMGTEAYFPGDKAARA